MTRYNLNRWQTVALGVGLAACGLLARDWRSPEERLTECKSNLKNIGIALEMYSTDWAGKYPTTLTKLVPNYLESIPQCPNAKRTYAGGLEFGPRAPHNTNKYQDYYYLCCKGLNHRDAGLQADVPWFDGFYGFIERAP